MKYSYPTEYQVKQIRKLTRQGLDKWEIEERINNPYNHCNLVIIDYIETEMLIEKNLMKWRESWKNKK